MIDRKGKVIEYISNQGPSVDILSPQISDTSKNNTLKNPLKIEIKFLPKDGKTVDLTTLKVELLKIIPIDITSMIKPYASENGIIAENISLPTGRHRLRLTICDSDKKRTQLIYNVNII